MGKLTVQDLVKHMETYKDALVIMGDAAIDRTPYTDDDCLLTNKALRRNPKDFWKAFWENVYIDPETPLTEAQKAIVSLGNKGLIGNVVNLTNDCRLNDIFKQIINLHGTSDKFKCTSCKTIYKDVYVKTCSDIVCEVCGKPLRPSILLEGENYFDDQFNAFKHLLLETHTLFVVGMNWTEDVIINLIADYSEMKEVKNATEEEQRMIVVVGGDDFIDVNEIGKFEFLVTGNVSESMSRLISQI